MATIRVNNEVKKELEEAMIVDIKKQAENPKFFVKALRKGKYGYTFSEFIEKLLSER